MEFRNSRTVVTALVCTLAVTLTACNMRVEKGEDGKEKKVDIATPLGGLKVRTDNVDARDTGLKVYPNSRLKPGEHNQDNDKAKANVDINTPFFNLKVVAVTYLTDDPPEKVLAFYRDDIKRFGNTVECNPAGKGEKKENHDLSAPVSCEGDGIHVKTGGDKLEGAIELKAGTNGNQRVVAVKPDGKGSEFSLVYLRMNKGEAEDSI
ncbi:MAG TPA: hypothetical protein VEG32_01105 [Clostridia bacterium]|nr:hypothetical protein [Clostridia bacterium]